MGEGEFEVSVGENIHDWSVYWVFTAVSGSLRKNWLKRLWREHAGTGSGWRAWITPRRG